MDNEQGQGEVRAELALRLDWFGRFGGAFYFHSFQVILLEPVHDGKKVEDRGIERCSRPMEPLTETCKTDGRPPTSRPSLPLTCSFL